ncbi:MAG: SIS domain-containing protein [Promethearchaeota archaeon]|nr:MAG: SIS domain-containing protein [Candidatus Lokiarchaeota archaeon]
MADRIEFSTEDGSEIDKRILFQAMELIMNNLKENMEHIDQNFKYTEKFINILHDSLVNKRRFFLLASGRSAFILQCFATRLVHLGADVFFVTNMATLPKLRKKDILIVLSGSGTTSIVVSLLKNYVNTVKPHAIICITSHPSSIIGRVGDVTIKILGRSKRDHSDDTHAVLTPEGTQFEQIAFTYLDAVIAELAVKMGKTNDDLLKNHSSCN